MDLGSPFFMRAIALSLPIVLLLAAPAHGEHVFGLGLRGTAMRVTPDHDADRALSLAGAGVQARWRFLPWLGVELAVCGLHGETAGGAFVRDSSTLTLSAMWHLWPRSRWDLYVVLGAGGTDDRITLIAADGAKIEQTFRESHVSLGLGLERLWTHWGVGAEVRAVGLARKDKDAALPGDAVAGKSSAAEANVVAEYYF